MTTFWPLVRLFLRDLIRRRLLWALAVATIAAFGIVQWSSRNIEDAIGAGESWDVATRRAASQLSALAESMRLWVTFAVTLLAAQVAPESRRNGTTQFLLSLGVRRHVMAAAQYVALALLLTAGVLLIHLGFSVAALRADAMTWMEVGLAWSMWLLPVLVLAAAVLSVSLTASAIETYLVFGGGAFVLDMLPEAVHGLPRNTPMVVVRGLQNLGLLLPSPTELVTWPHLSFGHATEPPYPEWRWALAQQLSAAAFWIVLGLWL